MFNLLRNCKTFSTKGFFFVEVGLYPRKRLAVPIRRNRSLDRFFGLLEGGWICERFGLTPSLEIIAFISKEGIPLTFRRNILGIDINVRSFAYTVLTFEGDVLKQGYRGQQIWMRGETLCREKGDAAVSESSQEVEAYAATGSKRRSPSRTSDASGRGAESSTRRS